MAICQVCLNQKRTPRFISVRLTICQWCITELGKALLSPSEVIENKRNLLHEQYRKSIEDEINQLQNYLKNTEIPALKTSVLIDAEKNALSEVKRNESALRGIYRSLFDDRKRLEQVRKLTEKYKAEIIENHQRTISEYNYSVKQEKAKRDELLTVSTRVNNAIENYLADVSNSRIPFSKEERIVRAYHLGILNFKREKTLRLNKQQDEEIKRIIRQQDLYHCLCCARGVDRGELHIHHIIPLYLYGTNNHEGVLDFV